MAFSYPLSMPLIPRPADGDVSPRPAQSITRGEFSGDIQVQDWQAGRWFANWKFPPMSWDVAGHWVGFLTGLDGMRGTFTASPIFAQANRGDLRPTVIPGSRPRVLGGNQTGRVLRIIGARENTAKWIRTGDYFSVGTGAQTMLLMAMSDADTGSVGDTEIDIWPDMRTPPRDGQLLELAAPRGWWRLEIPASWSVDKHGLFNVRLKAREAP